LRTGSGLGPTRRVARWFVFKPKIKILQGLAMDDVAIFYDHFGLFYGHWKYFMVIWYIFPRFGMLYQEKSGNLADPALEKSND
jgi:hypothetical protein